MVRFQRAGAGVEEDFVDDAGAGRSGRMMGFGTSGAKAPYSGKSLFAALKRCATQKHWLIQTLHAAVESYSSTGSGRGPSQRTRRTGHPGFVLLPGLFLAVLIVIISNP